MKVSSSYTMHPSGTVTSFISENFNADKILIDEAPKYDRERSQSPRPQRRGDSPRGGGRRSASPGGNGYSDSRYAV